MVIRSSQRFHLLRAIGVAILNLFLAVQFILDLLERLVLGLRHQEPHEQRAQHTKTGKYPERDAVLEPVQQILVHLDDHELQQRRNNAYDAQRQPFDVRTEQLAHHHAGYGTETQRERADVHAQADQRYQTEGGHVHVVFLQPEEVSQAAQADGHHRVGD